MICLAAEGIVDFTKARIRDPAWQVRMRLLGVGHQAKMDLQYMQASLAFDLAQMTSPHFASDVVGEAQKRAIAQFSEIVYKIRPWERPNEEDKRQQVLGLKELYKQACGDPDDPAYQKVIEATVHELLTRKDRAAQAAQAEQDLLRLVEQRRQAILQRGRIK